MWQDGAKRKKILRYLKEVLGKPLILKDVSNMIAEMRRNSYMSPDDNVRVTEVLQDFSGGPGNVVNVFRDPDAKLTSCITFQTSHMRCMARLFPEVVCVDATHGTNISRYRLFSFMLTDNFGSGAFELHALVDREKQENMKSAITTFKRNNGNWSDVKVIVIDKDFTELFTLSR
ncbi:hypothetical protein F441_12995 [Phytophthora nicotianae CJ01A1]|uniref:ZSWIM1/3 RNaseH-like domain-containing protein n=1 Tax=Phytophthora nicotianae CJ01A1 TaxID=1317063 RepID=W2WLQ3_PHYNI|nr:hypothetical protein F441_12995 [Phytophthora nicotianae CJ01A1]